jgi:hypothetical protein
MENLKNKLYNFEATPPEEVWKGIAEELQDGKVVGLQSRRRSGFLFYGATAAASIIIIFVGSLFFKKNKPNPTANVPVKVDHLLAQKIKDSINLNQKILETIIHNPPEKKEIIAKDLTKESHGKKYLTVAGPEGQPVKISPKVATLIVSADHEFPPKPVWSKKIDKWKKIMLSSTISPTSANLVDLIQVAATDDRLE